MNDANRRIRFVTRWVVAIAGLTFVPATPAQTTEPNVLDDRLELSLIAEDPVLRTPIGLAIDDADCLYVLESHTHDPPKDYSGPNHDRVLRFEDADGDGTFEGVTVFAEGIRMGMNLAFSPDGVLHVVSAKDVLALPDQDQDGVCDGNQLVVRMKAGSNYPHNCLLGITFDREGWMYLARGNVGSTFYEFNGADGSHVEGYGDGGSILRCRGDGTQIEEFATGFWNPIQIKFDRAGRLLCVDNDPDARGPNRLVHVVKGGDYGHRNMYGGSGNHPFQGWDGDLPGTLPYVSGTGEAPCDLLDATRTSFPSDFEDSVLVTVWNENSIERHRIHEVGVSIQGVSETLIQGGDDFRPVAIEADSKGNLYFTDWVLVDYPNHGRGRVWKLSASTAEKTIQPRSTHAPPIRSLGQLQLKQWDGKPFAESLGERVYTPNPMPADAATRQRHFLLSEDPFQRHVGVQDVASRANRREIELLSNDADERLRLAALLAASRCPGERTDWQLDITRRSLGDHDKTVRQAALIDVGTNRLAVLRDDVDRAIEVGDVDRTLFETYLACVECLNPEFIEAYESRTEGSAKKAPRQLDPNLLVDILTDPRRAADVRVLALSRLPSPLPAKAMAVVNDWIESPRKRLQMAAIGRLADADNSTQRLLSIASDTHRVSEVRCEALLELQRASDLQPTELFTFIDDDSEAVAVQAARTLKEFATSADVIAFASQKTQQVDNEAIRQSLELISGSPKDGRPASLDDWKVVLSSGGDDEAGRRVFHAQSATCRNCHQIGGHENTLGPNLGRIAQSVDREQIIHSIMRPSDQFAPQYQAWKILTDDGQIHVGLQIDHQSGGDIDLILTDGIKRRFEADTIDEYVASKTSVMPSGLEQNLTLSEMRDLVAYLESLR